MGFLSLSHVRERLLDRPGLLDPPGGPVGGDRRRSEGGRGGHFARGGEGTLLHCLLMCVRVYVESRYVRLFFFYMAPSAARNKKRAHK